MGMYLSDPSHRADVNKQFREGAVNTAQLPGAAPAIRHIAPAPPQRLPMFRFIRLHLRCLLHLPMSRLLRLRLHPRRRPRRCPVNPAFDPGASLGYADKMGRPDTPPLTFPRAFAFDIRRRDGQYCILDTVRQRFVPLTPEEWVRQNLLEYLVRDLGCPRSLIAVEKKLDYYSKPFRADVIVYRRDGVALLLAECKEPGVRLNQLAFDQVAAYNQSVRARYLLVTNGLEHYCWRLDPAADSGHFIPVLPRYEAW